MRQPPRFYLVLAAAAVLLCTTLVAAKLRHPVLFFELQGTWQRQVDDMTDTRLELAVKGNRMDYRFVSERFPELSSHLHTYRWVILDEDTVRIRYDETHYIDTDVAVEKGKITFSPAVTLQEDTEVWYRK